jgi:peptidyl-prolyl cis-trans isomerase B (cyclophilin B)
MNQRTRAWLVVLLAGLVSVLFLLSGCSSQSADSGSSSSKSQAGSQSTAASEAAPSTQESSLHTPTYQLNGKEIAVIKTNKGTIKTKFYEKDAPIASANFIELALKGFYNGIKFHRYVPNFVIQAGDPQTKSASAAEVAAADSGNTGQFGTGGPGYTIKDEYSGNPNKHVDGALAMARTQMPNSGGSQFYFALQPLPSLDGQYTVFGQATSGIDVIHQLRAGDEIESITIENASK